MYKRQDLGYGTGIYPEADYFACKMPVFSFEKLTDVDINLGPEMKSTGECLGIAESYPQALLKAFKGANMKAVSYTHLGGRDRTGSAELPGAGDQQPEDR